MNKKNFIDGLPISYDYNYVLNTEKQCLLCTKVITSEQIEINSIVCTENFEFIHKECLESADLQLIFTKPEDPTSLVKILKKK